MVAPSGPTPTPSFNIPAAVIQTIAQDVIGIPTPISIIGGLFGGGKMHPGKYSFRYIWDGIKIGSDGIASVSPVKVAMIYRQRLWRAGKKTSEPMRPFECFTYMIAKRLGDIINTKIPPEKRIPLKIAFQNLNPKFHVVTWAAHMKMLRQQGPANASFDALKYAPAVLNTYGNCVRQMLGVKNMYDFLINHIGWDYLYPLSPVMRPKWHSYWFKKADWEDYGEWLLDNLKYRNPAGVRNWMAKTGMKTYDPIILPKPKEAVKKPVPKKPAVKEQVENITQMKEVVKNLQEKQKGILDFLKMFEPSVAYAGSIEEFAKSSGHGTPVQQITIKKEEKKSIFDAIDIGDMLLFGAVAVPAVLLLTKRKR